MTAVTNTRSFRRRETKHALERTFTQENAYLILLHGCSLVEDLNNFRLCGSALSHANTGSGDENEHGGVYGKV